METHRVAEQALGRLVQLPGYFASAVTVEAAEPEGDEIVFLRVRTSAGILDEVPIQVEVLEIALRSAEQAIARVASPQDLFLLVESARIRLAYAFDPYFAVSLSGIEALPHQLEAVYERMLPQSRLRFLLAHDPGAGKTIMAGLLLKELKLRGVLDRVLIVSPAPLTIQWQDELLNRFGLAEMRIESHFCSSNTSQPGSSANSSPNASIMRKKWRRSSNRVTIDSRSLGLKAVANAGLCCSPPFIQSSSSL